MERQLRHPIIYRKAAEQTAQNIFRRQSSVMELRCFQTVGEILAVFHRRSITKIAFQPRQLIVLAQLSEKVRIGLRAIRAKTKELTADLTVNPAEFIIFCVIWKIGTKTTAAVRTTSEAITRVQSSICLNQPTPTAFSNVAARFMNHQSETMFLKNHFWTLTASHPVHRFCKA